MRECITRFAWSWLPDGTLFTPVPKDPDQSFHAFLTQLPEYEGQVTGYHFFPPRHGVVVAGYEGPHAEWFGKLGFSPYGHQARALQTVAAGHDVVVSTSTASGKSLTFQLPVLDALRSHRSAFLLYPTKALANDQLLRLKSLAQTLGVASENIATYDGDTRADKRAALRQSARVVLTNPDMLHYGILPHHNDWASFLSSLEYVVVDELHAYRGVLGSHVANVLRRLLRMAAAYGASPVVVAASATIGNPSQHAANLTGRRFTLVSDDEAPAAAREFLIWQPPAAGEESDRRRSANSEAARLAATFAREGVRSLFFCNSRRGAELVRRYAAGLVGEPLGSAIQSYRAGYTYEDRRLIEQGFKNGDITVLTSTSALELGVDIGGLDAVVLVGYPGSKMAMWQRSGRAGRAAGAERAEGSAGSRALTLLIPGADPLDEYYRTHPDLLIDGPVEDAVADPFNDELHPRHLLCAAAEMPLEQTDQVVAPWAELDRVDGLVESAGRFRSATRYPHRRVQLRGTGGRLIRLKDGMGRSLGATDFATALRELHPGAVHLHQGEQYMVASLDLERGIARLLPHIEDYYTQPRSETDIEILGPLPERQFGEDSPLETLPPGVWIGRVRVRHQVVGYVRKRYFSEAVLEERVLDLPEVSYDTQAAWFDLSGAASLPAAIDLPGALHALEHTLIGLLPSFVLCERADVGGVSYPLYPATGGPLVFVYDGAPGGVGYARAGAAVFNTWLTAARDLLAACPCEAGCPRCVLSPKCGNGNQFLDKRAAMVLADALLAR